MPRSAGIPDLHHLIRLLTVLSVRGNLLVNNYFVSVSLFAVLLKYFYATSIN
jgi:hypothetical protein